MTITPTCTPPYYSAAAYIQVRNSGTRTLFLAVSSQAPRLTRQAWRHVLWEMLFPLAAYVHMMADTSSSAEAAAVELGRERGRAVHMLVHHSRNTEQKQWYGCNSSNDCSSSSCI
jgi:C-terminal region of Mon2 protein